MVKAFTVVELIFIIVIIGILSSIALPKLNATRDDAKINSIISTTKNIINNSKAFYSAKGEKQWNVANIYSVTNKSLFTDSSCLSQITNTTKVLSDGSSGTFYICDNRDNIVKLDFNKSHLVVSPTNINTTVAKGVRNSSSFKSIAHPHRLSGIAVSK